MTPLALFDSVLNSIFINDAPLNIPESQDDFEEAAHFELSLDDLCREFDLEFSIWKSAQRSGVASAILRMQIRRLLQFIDRIQSIPNPNDPNKIALLSDQFQKVADAAKHNTAETLALERRKYHETICEIPELMLFELDQILDVAITPEMLADFDLDQEPPDA